MKRLIQRIQMSFKKFQLILTLFREMNPTEIVELFAQFNSTHSKPSALDQKISNKNAYDHHSVYFESSSFSLAKHRIGWLLFLMFSAMITQTIITHFEDAFVSLPILVSFIPMITDTGGNCGAQASTIVVRGLALNEIKSKDFFRVLLKELKISLWVALALSLTNGCYILIRYHNLMLALLIGLSLTCTIILSKVVGAALPIIASFFKTDPAVMATPLITTIVDAGSIMIYFSIATFLLQLF